MIRPPDDDEVEKGSIWIARTDEWEAEVRIVAVKGAWRQLSSQLPETADSSCTLVRRAVIGNMEDMLDNAATTWEKVFNNDEQVDNSELQQI